MADARHNALIIVTIVALVAPWRAAADEVAVAVASNFADAAAAIATRFEAESGHRVILSPGSTGMHYAQIVGGAPFAVFLAADERRPALLEDEGAAVAGTRFAYALGRLVLWSASPEVVDDDGAVLEHGDFAHLAVASPDLAPYGRAARDVLETLGLWDALQGRLVRGENIAQTHQFVASGAAALGFVALSQVRRPGWEPVGSEWEVPATLYAPIVQQAVLIRDEPAARAFLDYLRGDTARGIIRSYGYGVP